MMSIALLPLVLVLVGQTGGNVISVSNGGELGEWGPTEKCPEGTVAKGFSLKVQNKQYLGDDTALNGISLQCVNCYFPHHHTSINSTVGQWGQWGDILWCPYGFLNAFQLRVETPQGAKDDTAANNIKFSCSDRKILDGYGRSWGKYGNWSEVCKIGIDGIQTRVQGDQGKEDNTSLNNVRFTCKKSQRPQYSQQGNQH